MNEVVIMIGGNIGNVKEAFEKVKSQYFNTPTLLHKRSSSLYMSAPWATTSTLPFYNQAVVCTTDLLPSPLMQKLLSIESAMGRTRDTPTPDRTLDLDILYYNDWIIQHPTVIIPHPRLHLRRFCTLPLQELLPDYIHPVLQLNNLQLNSINEDTMWVNVA